MATRITGRAIGLPCALFTMAALIPTHAAAQSSAAAMAARPGTIVVANRGDGTVSAIDVSSDQVTASAVMPDAGEPMYVVYSAIGDCVLIGDRTNDRVVAFDATTLDLVGVAPAGAGVFHMWGNDQIGQLWVSNDMDNTLSVIDLHTMQQINTIPIAPELVALGGKPHDVIIDPEGTFAYATIVNITGPTDYVVQFDVATGTEVNRAAVGDDPHLSLTSATNLLYVPSQGAGAMYVFDRLSMNIVDIVLIPRSHGAGMPEDGGVFYTTNLPGGGADAIFTIDTTTLQVLGEATDAPADVPHNIALTPDGRKLYITHSGANNIVSVYAAMGENRLPQLIGTVTVGANPFGIDFVP